MGALFFLLAGDLALFLYFPDQQLCVVAITPFQEAAFGLCRERVCLCGDGLVAFLGVIGVVVCLWRSGIDVYAAWKI